MTEEKIEPIAEVEPEAVEETLDLDEVREKGQRIYELATKGLIFEELCKLEPFVEYLNYNYVVSPEIDDETQTVQVKINPASIESKAEYALKMYKKNKPSVKIETEMPVFNGKLKK